MDASATLAHCKIMYGGTQSHREEGDAALSDDSYSNGTTISSTTFAYNRRGLDLLSPNSSITNSTFSNNEYPLRIGLDTSIDNTLDFSVNKFNAIFVGGNVRPGEGTSLQWLNAKAPYVLNETLYLSGTVVNLGTGTIVKVWHGESIVLADGAALQNFQNAAFTSYRDDARGGDVDGTTVAPRIGDWEGIWDHDDWLIAPNIFYATKHDE